MYAPAIGSSLVALYGLQIFLAVFAIVAATFSAIVFDYWPWRFVFSIVISGILVAIGYAMAMLRPSTYKSNANSSTVDYNIVVCIVALTGLFALWFDRTAVRGIDYADVGIAAARAELNREGERGGAISIYGNLFSVLIFLPLINMFFDWDTWPRRRLIVFVAVVVGLAGLTYLTAGRTVVLIAMAFIGSAMMGRKLEGKSVLPSFLNWTRFFVSLAAVLFLFGSIFALRADAFGASSSGNYLSDLCIHLSQPAIEIVTQCAGVVTESKGSWASDLINYFTAVLLYAFHVSWVGEAVLIDDNGGLNVSFAGFINLFLGRFGFELSATDYDGYFIPAAAGLVFDFGYLVAGFSFLLLGLLVGAAQKSMINRRSGFGRLLFCYTIATILLSVLISTANLPFFLLSVLAILVTSIARRFGLLISAPGRRRSRVGRF